MSDIELKELLDYCQSNGRICLIPYDWDMMFRKFRIYKKHVVSEYPPPIFVLGSWDAHDDQKRLRFLTHIYWGYKHGLFSWIKRYVDTRDNNKWHVVSSYEHSPATPEEGYGYIPLDKVKEEYEKWDKYNE